MTRHETLSPQAANVLVIGYGDERHGDDAVGAIVARTVASWALPGARALAVSRLSAELAVDLSAATWVVFIDAHHTDADIDPRLERVRPLEEAPRSAAVGDPASLLSLTAELFGYVPQAWLVMVPASSFEPGAELSPITDRGRQVALRFVRNLVASTTPTLVSRRYGHDPADTPSYHGDPTLQLIS